MKDDILDFYLKMSIYTNYLPYEDYYKSLPDNIEELSKLLYHQVIHREELIRSYSQRRTYQKLFK